MINLKHAAMLIPTLAGRLCLAVAAAALTLLVLATGLAGIWAVESEGSICELDYERVNDE